MNERRVGFTLVELLVVIAIIAMLVGILLPAVGSSRAAARNTQCKNNLRQIGIGLLNYHTTNSKFPPGATIPKRQITPGYSWHVFILPHIEQQALYDRIDPQTDGVVDQHGELRQVEVSSFFCPSADSAIGDSEIFPSHYVGVSGAGRNDQFVDLEDSNCGDYFIDGLLYPRSETSTAHVRDGQSKTIMVGERAYTTNSWMDGAYWVQSPKRDTCTRSTKNVRWRLNCSFDECGYPRELSSQKPVGAKSLLENDIMYSSNHSGGVHFVYVDGHVVFHTDDMDLECLKHLATIRGGEAVCD